MGDSGKAFAKGGAGCCGAFLVIAVLAVLFGGSAHVDIGGVILLFVIGGVIGLVVNWIYQKGKSDSGPSGSDDDPSHFD